MSVKAGDQYGRLTILFEVDKRNNRRQFRCRCTCGNEGIFRFTSLRFGHVKSCGCLKDEKSKTTHITHGKWHSRPYKIWHSMKQRCLNPNNAAYKYYGARRISICSEWITFEGFYSWVLTSGYADHLTIDRIDVNGNYEPQNCRWATRGDQNRNTRRSKILVLSGTSMCQKDWAKKLGISNTTLQKRLKKWGLEKALTTPKQL